MTDLQLDLNSAILAVKEKCVELDERIQREDEKPENRGRGFLGVRRYIYALTTKNSEHALYRRGRSLTRIYMEQKYYRSKSLPSPEQVQRFEDCEQDFGENGRERIEFSETVQSPLVELIKEDRMHSEVVKQRIPSGHAEWDHELCVFEEDGISGLLEDRTLTVRAGDHPLGLNSLPDVADKVSAKIGEFFHDHSEIRTRELGLSVNPVYQETGGLGLYTSYGMSKSMHSLREEPKPRTDAKIENTTASLSELYSEVSRHDYESRYGKYASGVGRFGESRNYESSYKHVYDVPKIDYRRLVTPVELPLGYHNYYEPSSVIIDNSRYSQGNITRPLHYQYTERNTFETYSDYILGTTSRAESAVAEPPQPILPVLSRSADQQQTPLEVHVEHPTYYNATTRRISDEPQIQLEFTPTHVEYYDSASRVTLELCKDAETVEFQARSYPDYYDSASIPILELCKDAEPVEFQTRSYPDYYDSANIPILELHTDLERIEIETLQHPEYYDAYETQEIIAKFDAEPIYDEIAEQPDALQILCYTRDPCHVDFIPSVPDTPIPAPPHLDEIYVGQHAVDVAIVPAFGADECVPRGGRSVQERVREMEESARREAELVELEKRNAREQQFHQLQEEIRVARVDLLAEEHGKDTPAPPPPAPSTITIPEVFVAPTKPKRKWERSVVLVKGEEEEARRSEKPLGPVIFHELIYQQGILRKMFEEEQQHSAARPVSRPVSRANSRPSTPAPENRAIDVPRIDKVRNEEISHVDYLEKRIELYNTYGNTHDAPKYKENCDVIYDEPTYEPERVYDTPSDDIQEKLDLELGKTNKMIREMSRSNNWVERGESMEQYLPPNSPFRETRNAEVHTTISSSKRSTTTTSLNRANIPAPLSIPPIHQFSSHHNSSIGNEEHTNHGESTGEATQIASDHNDNTLNVGHVKELAKLYNKPGKPLTTEQVIYRERLIPYGQNVTESKDSPKKLRRIPLDEIELHEHSQDHISKQHGKHEINGNCVSKVMVNTNNAPAVRVRRVYRAIEDEESSILSPISLQSDDGPFYSVPNDAT